ncbi:hypothetical protein [Streptomyces sp. NPDC005435]|uniref:hypothetical protein n=1 Tax=Streptomyces sp. NPDC005435 TaxID=3154464 RepID=UPI003451B41F
MTYRRAVLPALAGTVLLALLLWWAGASAQALRLPGAGTMIDPQSTYQLRQLLAPWSYDPPAEMFGGDAGYQAAEAPAAGGDTYASLYRTAMQIRYATLVVVFLAGALLLVRRLPPVRGRTPATLLAVWAWSLVAATLALTVSAPWSLASREHSSYRVLPQISGIIGTGQQMAVFAGLVAALGTALVARIAAKGAEEPPRREVAPRAARLSASAGTAVVALSLVVLSYQSVAAAIQTAPYPGGLLSEPGELLRQWLLLGFWTPPTSAAFGDWLLYRLLDVLLLAVVWWSLRLLPALLTRVTVSAMALCGVCATVLGLLASQLARLPLNAGTVRWGPLYVLGQLGGCVPAAITFGTAAGVTAAVVWRVAGGREPAGASESTKSPEPAETAEGAAEA